MSRSGACNDFMSTRGELTSGRWRLVIYPSRAELAEPGGIGGGLLDNTREDHVGQKAGVFGEEAEDDAVKEVGDLAGVEAVIAHGIGDAGKMVGGVLGDGGARAAGAEGLGVVEDRPHDFDVAGFGKGFKGYVVGDGNGAGEVGVNDDAVKVANNQQGRILQGVAVSEELVIGFVQVLVLAFVLCGAPH